MFLVDDVIVQESTEEERPVFASIGRLSVSLIHELRNPLDGVHRYIRLLLDQMPENDPKRMYAERAQDGLAWVAKIFKELLDFTRQSMSNTTPVDIEQSLRKALLFFRGQIRDQGINVETKVDEDMPFILGADIAQIFTNIIKNAIQAMPDGGILSIEARMVPPALLEVRFADTGPGIPHEMLERIYDPFFTTKDSQQCVGLGLFICREIAESHNGSIDVELSTDLLEIIAYPDVRK